MTEYRLFPEGTVPDCATAGWYEGRETAPHVDQDLHRRRLNLTRQFVVEACDAGGFTSVVDLGAGDGGFLWSLDALRPELSTWGYDLQPSNISVAINQRLMNVTLLDFVNDVDLVRWADVVVCTEVLEHLIDPGATLRAAHADDRPQTLVCSSPHTETAQNHYEYHLWAWDLDGYEQLLRRNGWQVVGREFTEIFQVVAAVRV